jgi:xanthine dehydrogenase accessory factor
MNRIRAIAGRWLAQGVPAVVVEVMRVEGSAPRHAGTRMLVTADRTEGTIGGGHLEFVAIATARQVLAGAEPPPDTRYALGPSLGQCCGVVVWLRVGRLDAGLLADWPATPPRLRIAVAGNGHVGRALVALLATLPVEVDWLATLADEGTPPPDPQIAEGLVRLHVDDDPVGALRDLAPGSHLRILTHSHALDFELAAAALRGTFQPRLRGGAAVPLCWMSTGSPRTTIARTHGHANDRSNTRHARARRRVRASTATHCVDHLLAKLHRRREWVGIQPVRSLT